MTTETSLITLFILFGSYTPCYATDGICLVMNGPNFHFVRPHCDFYFQLNCSSSQTLEGYCYKDENGQHVILDPTRFVSSSTPDGILTFHVIPQKGDEGDVYCTAPDYDAARLEFHAIEIPASTIELISQDDNTLTFTCRLRGDHLSAQKSHWDIHLLRNKQRAGTYIGAVYTRRDDLLEQDIMATRNSSFDNYTCRVSSASPVTYPCVEFRDSVNSYKESEFRNPGHSKADDGNWERWLPGVVAASVGALAIVSLIALVLFCCVCGRSSRDCPTGLSSVPTHNSPVSPRNAGSLHHDNTCPDTTQPQTSIAIDEGWVRDATLDSAGEGCTFMSQPTSNDNTGNDYEPTPNPGTTVPTDSYLEKTTSLETDV